MDYPHLILARMYEYIEPIDRGERYEDPLEAVLETRGLGRVTGGGSALNALGGIMYVDVELEVADRGDSLQVIVDALESAGAPQGSELIDTADESVLRTFGTQQCLAIYLDGVSLPEDVYAELDFEAVIAEIGAAAGEGSYRGFWQGPEETGIFYFGPNADSMFARVEPVLRALPIGQNARVVVREGKEALGPREVRMPRD